MNDEVEMLTSSRLGTQNYWEELYKRENENFKDTGDEGEVWFGEDAMYRMVKFIDKMAEDEMICYESPIIDLGTGNGYVEHFPHTEMLPILKFDPF